MNTPAFELAGTAGASRPSSAYGGIFISYRREEAAGYAGRLRDRLVARFGQDQVFMDVDAIEPGLDFAEEIEAAVQSCQILLAVIGKRWLTATDKDGRLRLDDPDDLVRLEIEAALSRNTRVIPVLVDGAAMPRRNDLPEPVRSLARRHAHELSHSRFDYDAEQLLEIVEKVLNGTSGGAASKVTLDYGRRVHAVAFSVDDHRLATGMTTPPGCGTWPRTVRRPGSSTRRPCLRWRSARPGIFWRQEARMAPCMSGRSRPARRSCGSITTIG